MTEPQNGEHFEWKHQSRLDTIVKIRMKNITRFSSRFPRRPLFLPYIRIILQKCVINNVTQSNMLSYAILSGDLQNDQPFVQTHNGESASEKTGIPSQSRRATNSAGGIANSS